MRRLLAITVCVLAPGRTLRYEFTVNGDVLTLIQEPTGPGLKFMRVQ